MDLGQGVKRWHQSWQSISKISTQKKEKNKYRRLNKGLTSLNALQSTKSLVLTIRVT
jgi:hypothetical protein